VATRSEKHGARMQRIPVSATRYTVPAHVLVVAATHAAFARSRPNVPIPVGVSGTISPRTSRPVTDVAAGGLSSAAT
jgi:hypothetical protein